MNNNDINKIKQLKAYTRFDGLFVGVAMSLNFLLMLYSVSQPQFTLFSYIFALCIAFCVAKRVFNYQSNIICENISFARAFAYSFYTFLYGSIILSVIVLVWFQWFDHGMFAQSYIDLVKSVHDDASLSQLIKETDIENIETLIRGLSPIDYAFNFLFTSIIFSAITSIVIAFITISFRKKT